MENNKKFILVVKYIESEFDELLNLIKDNSNGITRLQVGTNEKEIFISFREIANLILLNEILRKAEKIKWQN